VDQHKQFEVASKSMGINQWRILYHSAQDGATNMAVDQAIMEAVGRGEAPPTLRFYAWEPACLSLGYAQHADEVDFDRLAAHGWDIVRRPTGGKAILHTDELTYSVTAPEAHPIMQGGILESYRRISNALLQGLARLDLSAQITSQEEAGKAVGPVCFEVPSNYEVTSQGKKLIGSAQVRRKSTVLQHGTVPLFGDVTRICDVLVYDDELVREWARTRVLERATTIETALGRFVDWQAVADAMLDGFRDTFQLSLHEGDLSEQESDRAEVLRDTVYSTLEWTQKL
jgi:lipoate-protein ligase A